MAGKRKSVFLAAGTRPPSRGEDMNIRLGSVADIIDVCNFSSDEILIAPSEIKEDIEGLVIEYGEGIERVLRITACKWNDTPDPYQGYRPSYTCH